MAPTIPLAPGYTKEQVKVIRDAAQNALHTMWKAGKKDDSRAIYGGMRVYVNSHGGNISGSAAKVIARARQLIASLPSELAGPLNNYFAVPAKVLYDAKGDGYPAPPQVGVGDIRSGPGDIRAGDLLPGGGTLTDISGFLSALTQRNTWLRIGEGLLGLLLIGIGVAAITKGTPIGSAIRTGVNATPVGKVTKVLK